jgi:predicted nucleotidyltransferase
MATIRLPPDFKEFLRLLNSNGVEYLLIGGYAVGYYGYPRPTGDMDIWIARTAENANKVVDALQEFGFTCTTELLLEQKKVVRMGVPPFRLEILTTISGVDFPTCYAKRLQVVLDEIEVSLISLLHLKLNKKASGRSKDITDLENLP